MDPESKVVDYRYLTSKDLYSKDLVLKYLENKD